MKPGLIALILAAFALIFGFIVGSIVGVKEAEYKKKNGIEE